MERIGVLIRSELEGKLPDDFFRDLDEMGSIRPELMVSLTREPEKLTACFCILDSPAGPRYASWGHDIVVPPTGGYLFILLHVMILKPECSLPGEKRQAANRLRGLQDRGDLERAARCLIRNDPPKGAFT